MQLLHRAMICLERNYKESKHAYLAKDVRHHYVMSSQVWLLKRCRCRLTVPHIMCSMVTNRKSNLEVSAWAHGNKLDDHLSCEDACEDLAEVRGEFRGQSSEYRGHL